VGNDPKVRLCRPLIAQLVSQKRDKKDRRGEMTGKKFFPPSIFFDMEFFGKFFVALFNSPCWETHKSAIFFFFK
jgi:hypothetical protein